VTDEADLARVIDPAFRLTGWSKPCIDLDLRLVFCPVKGWSVESSERLVCVAAYSPFDVTRTSHAVGFRISHSLPCKTAGSMVQ